MLPISEARWAAPLLLSAFTQHVFSLRFVLPKCEAVSCTVATRAATTVGLNHCVWVCLCSALAVERNPRVWWGWIGPVKVQEMLRGFYCLTFFKNLQTP